MGWGEAREAPADSAAALLAYMQAADIGLIASLVADDLQELVDEYADGDELLAAHFRTLIECAATGALARYAQGATTALQCR